MQCVPSKQGFPLLSFPPEILLEIAKRLGWEEVLSIRQTCRLLFEITNAREVWVSLFWRLSRENIVPPVLECSLSSYTAAELELVVMRRVSSEKRLRAGEKARERVYLQDQIPMDDEQYLLDGGKWLLTMCNEINKWGRVYVYNLDGEPSGQCIIDLGISTLEDADMYMSCDRDLNNKDVLAYTVCLSPRFSFPPEPFMSVDGDWPGEGIHIYRLIAKGRGENATLEAKKVKYLRYPQFIEPVYDITLRGDYFVQCLEQGEEDDDDPNVLSFEVWNWVLSDTLFHFKARIDVDVTLSDSDISDCDLVLLPSGKAVTFTHCISVYDLSNIRPTPIDRYDEPWALQPYWMSANFSFSSISAYSDPWRDSQVSRLSVVLDGIVFGLTVPHDKSKDPWYQQISDVNVSKFTIADIGMNKLLLYEEKDGRTILTTVGFLWDNDTDLFPKDHLPSAVGSPSRPFSTYICDLVPVFDESSNRLVVFSKGSCILLDFAYK
ncbi:hypothetical protein BDN70DRAFT_920155 [Pholiota conissans]|uniref:F-box domain-containing protein n=1 Tax=Pholiota conissans TaxID=109636 RepID=A0A9P5Z5A0_9AGAR|nr:hypothetical protein BDN70DRAFT_920155 [Pholiota conissans]